MTATADVAAPANRGEATTRPHAKKGAASPTSAVTSSTANRGSVADSVVGLDMILGDAALGPLRRMVPPAGVLLRFAGSLAMRPGAVIARGTTLATDLKEIATGESRVAPAKGDKRFADAAWQGNGLLRRSMQGYLATSRTALGLVDDAELDWRDGEQLHLSVSNLCDALAPSNNPVLNPLMWKALIDTGGRSAVSGIRRLVSDLANTPRVPSMVDPDAFTVGEDLAISPGAVVFRSPVFELIQYKPVTELVRTVPLLMVPPTINKYYIADLAPGRSMVEYLVAQGQQVFMMSWRNPDASMAAWDLDTYGEAVIDAMDSVEKITGHRSAAVMAFCSGGIITSAVMAHLVSTGQADRIAALALAVTVIDQKKAGTVGALMDPISAKNAIAASEKKGYLDGAMLAEVFAWLRPNDLVWSYWVNNYLQGKPPAAFDILYWNADTTRMPASLHRDFVEISVENSLTKPGGVQLLGTPIDLKGVKADNYVIAGVADHLCQWQSCYSSTQLLGGQSRFILSTSGHIASLINPPDNPKSSFRAAAVAPPTADEWLAAAETQRGSWWPDFAEWLGERCGDQIDAPARLAAGEPAVASAPGTYVYEK